MGFLGSYATILVMLGLTTPPLFANSFGEWQEQATGGDTACARGGDYVFFHRMVPDSRQLVIDFRGGGACWDSATCGEDSPFFVDTVDKVRDQVTQGLGGIHQNRVDNPFAGWSGVVLPYCTGDLHMGENDHLYSGQTIQHRGATNTKAVLAWLGAYSNQFDQVLVAGCSAGAYGSIYWTPHLREIFAGAEVVQLGDCGAGMMTSQFRDAVLANWQIETNAPSWIPELDPQTNPWDDFTVDQIYQGIGDFYPEVRLSQINSAADQTQILFYLGMGGNAFQWSRLMRSSMSSLDDSLANFDYVIPNSSQHCFITEDNFFTVKRGDQSLAQWVASMFLTRHM